jgi:hypothetical protein
MKKLIVVFVTSCCGFLSYAHADNAVGAVLGDPTGISARFGMDSAHSLEGALAYTWGDHEGMHLHGTYLWDKAREFRTSQAPIYLYYGLGVRVIAINAGKYDGDVAVGPRAPIGLLYNINNPDIELFGELSLALDVTPKTDVDLDVGIGVRVRF